MKFWHDFAINSLQLTINNYDKTSRKGAKYAKKQYNKLRALLRFCEKKKIEKNNNVDKVCCLLTVVR